MENNSKHVKPSPLARRVMRVTGSDWCGNNAPPTGDSRSLYVRDDEVVRVVSMVDDGGFVGIGYPDEWHAIMRTETARMFAWWVLRQWAADWFGLRSAIYYRALSRVVNGEWKRLGSGRKFARRSSHDEWLQERAPERGAA